MKINKVGRVVTVKMEILSEADQSYVKGRLAEAKLRDRKFETSPFGEMIKGEWVKVEKEMYGIPFQVYGTKRLLRSKTPVPLFLHLHGAGARATEIKLGKVEIAPKEVIAGDRYDKNPSLVIVPLCPPDTSWGDHVAAIEKIVDALLKTAPVDHNRLYLSGYSMGARGCDSLIKSRPKFYAAALLADGAPNKNWVKITDTALWLVYSGERELKEAERVVKEYQDAGKVAQFKGFPEAGHNQIHWKLAKDKKVFPWMFEQVRSVK